MYGSESWTVKKAEHQRIDAFELWCWKRPLRVLWMARSSNQFILKEISPEYSLERLVLELKLQCFDHLMGRTDSFGKTLMLENIENKKEQIIEEIDTTVPKNNTDENKVEKMLGSFQCDCSGRLPFTYHSALKS